MKILIVTDAWHPQVNGVVRTYEHLCEELVKLGHQVKVIGPADFPWTIPAVGYNEIRLTLFPYRSLASMIADYAPDHLHIATEGPLGWASRKYAQENKMAASTSYHTQFPEYLGKRLSFGSRFLYNLTHDLTLKYLRAFHAYASPLMVATQGLEDELRRDGFRAPMARLSRGVNFDLFFPGEKTLFKDLKHPVALNVGRVAIEKNLVPLLEMDWPGSIVIVGDGPDRGKLSCKYPHAHFAGKKTGFELAEYYRSADVFVFPSLTETFGLVTIEALASGLPVAGYKEAMGIRDIITEPFLGALDHDLSSAAKKAFACSGSAQQRSDYARANYTWENMALQFVGAIT